MAGVQDRLLNLWEQKQVEKVMLRFGRALDTGDWAGYRSCFIETPTVDFERLTGAPKVKVDADLFTRFAEQILSPVRRHHVYSNFDVEVDGDRATAHVYMTARHWRATDLGTSINTQYGWYDVRFVREGGEWLIAYLKHDFQWIDGNGALLDMSDPELGKTMAAVFCEENFAAAAQDDG